MASPGQEASRQGARAKPRPRVYTKEAAQDRLVELLRTGMTIVSGLEKVGRSRKTYEQWRNTDKEFAARVDQARALRGKRDETVRGERLGFAEFRKKYLKTETFWHQLQWVDLLEGRDPRDLHEAQTYVPGKRNRLLVLTPPFHSKSITLTVDYSVYRLCMDPSFRILTISAGSQLAQDFLFAVKQRLTSPDFIDLQKAYAPDGGWENTAESWTEGRIVFGTDVRAQGSKTSHEKDPNFQAVGMRSKIYGKRADLIFIDDGVDGTNVNEFEKQLKWIRREVSSRLEAGGKLVVVGTRIAPVDLYSELLDPDNYANGKVPWTHLASPAILEEGATPADHVTLWPYSDEPWVQRGEDADECLCEDPTCVDGLLVDGVRRYARWDGVHLEAGPRAENNATEWALVYQQKSVPENAIFPEHAIKRCMNVRRMPGLLLKETEGYPHQGMHGMYIIAGCDPAVKGRAGLIVQAVDRDTQKRYILSAWNVKAPTPDELKKLMREITEHYGVNEWRVERTGLLQFFTQDAQFRQWFSTRGVLFREHFTGGNKWDASFGVASMSGLLGQWDRATGPHGEPTTDWRQVSAPLVEFPRAMNDGMKAFQHQMVIWTPDLDPSRVPCDVVMAWWFAEIGARDYLGHASGSGVVTAIRRSNRFVSPRSRKAQTTVRLADLQSGNF